MGSDQWAALAGAPEILNRFVLMAKKSKRKLSSITIEKASHESETFSEEKLYRSLRQTKASKELVERVMRLLRDQVQPGITTGKLYRMAYSLLYQESRHLAARYSLKKAIMNLGPSGYPFEKLIAALFAIQGYETQLDVALEGACVKHEVDVVAARKNFRLLVECKFHNDHGKKCDVKVALYVHARSQDLSANPEGKSFDEFWLATNTKFTKDAISYGECSGLKLLSWDHPKGKGLKELIPLSQVHPITCLTTLKVKDKKELLGQNIVLCKELQESPELLENIGLKDPAIRRTLVEIDSLITI